MARGSCTNGFPVELPVGEGRQMDRGRTMQKEAPLVGRGFIVNQNFPQVRIGGEKAAFLYSE
jgi:hypothetical protein